MASDIEGQLSKLSLKEGDILVLNYDAVLNREHSVAMADRLKELSGWPNVVVVDSRGQLGAIRMEQAQAAIAEGQAEGRRRSRAKPQRSAGVQI